MYKAYEIDGLIDSHAQSVTRSIAGAQDGPLIARLSFADLAMLDAQIWFEGLRSRLASMSQTEQETLASNVISACDQVQAEVQRFYDGIVADGLTQEVAECAAHARATAMVLFDELELLRWDALEWQADADVSAGRVSGPFTSVDSLMASLMH